MFTVTLLTLSLVPGAETTEVRLSDLNRFPPRWLIVQRCQEIKQYRNEVWDYACTIREAYGLGPAFYALNTYDDLLIIDYIDPWERLQIASDPQSPDYVRLKELEWLRGKLSVDNYFIGAMPCDERTGDPRGTWRALP